MITHLSILLQILTVAVSSESLLSLDKPFANVSRIINGEEVTSATEYNYQVSLEIPTSRGIKFCSGAIISNEPTPTTFQWIVTVAQCLRKGTVTGPITVSGGGTMLDDGGRFRVTVNENDVTIHEEFDYYTLRNDLAVIKLPTPLPITDAASPISFKVITDLEVRDIIVSGWGSTRENGQLVNNLRTVTLHFQDLDACNADYRVSYFETGQIFCANSNSSQIKNICDGDSGDPAVIIGVADNITYLVGLASFIHSAGCESNHPAGFTHLSGSYYDWIINNTAS